MPDPLSQARQTLAEAGQDRLVAHAHTLGPEPERALLLEAAGHPWEALRAALQATGQGHPELRPPQALTGRRQAAQPALRARVAALGRGLLEGGRVATLLLAGGQGTRLGFDGPKGDVVFGPEADRTLYRIHGERIAAVSRAVGRPVPLLVLVSPQTEAATRTAFAAAEAWGLASDQVRILVQGHLPCLDIHGQAILADADRIATAPDGHGGAFEALRAQGVLEDLAEAGIDVLTTFQVDNPLGRPLDPVMLGWMVERRLQAIGKAVRKRTPDEKVGVFARDLRGRTRVVEYSELAPPEDEEPTAGQTAVAGALTLGSIAIHGFALPWLRELAAADFHLPLHRAWKRVPHRGPEGTPVDPEEPNAWKLERFIFDLFPKAARAEVHEVRRAWDFAPVKNATGEDSLESARALVAEEVRRWHRERGLPEPANPSLRPLEVDGGDESVHRPLG